MRFRIGEKVKTVSGEIHKIWGIGHKGYVLENGEEYSEDEIECQVAGDGENVNHPSHYNQGKYEVIDVINDWEMNFNLGNAIKYIARCDFKGKPVEDLQKAIFYLNDEIKRRENADD